MPRSLSSQEWGVPQRKPQLCLGKPLSRLILGMTQHFGKTKNNDPVPTLE